mmetsp:Transcript_88334/g.285963  ORF Transcript_88334/g.285963 Transcript_88334/m.285963 type:complete len:466 (-) Transcript_88334:193-1590(-)
MISRRLCIAGALALLSMAVLLCLGSIGTSQPRAMITAKHAINLNAWNPFDWPGMVSDGVDHFNKKVVVTVCHEEERLINTTCWHSSWNAVEEVQAELRQKSQHACAELTSHFNATHKAKVGQCEAKFGLAAFVNLKCEVEKERTKQHDFEVERNKSYEECSAHWIRKVDCKHHTIPNPKLAWQIKVYFKHRFNFAAKFSSHVNYHIKGGTHMVQKWTTGVTNSTEAIIQASAEIRFLVENKCRAQWALDGNLKNKFEAWFDSQEAKTCRSLQARFKAEHSGSHETDSTKHTWSAGIAAEVYLNCTARVSEKKWYLIQMKERNFIKNCTKSIMAGLGGGFDMSFINSAAASFEAKVHTAVELTMNHTAVVEFDLVANQTYNHFKSRSEMHSERLFADVPTHLASAQPRTGRVLGPIVASATAVAAVAALLVAARRSQPASLATNSADMPPASKEEEEVAGCLIPPE